MILTCPACSKRYVVPDSAIGPGGRRVRCAACRHSWLQGPPVLDLGPAEAAPAPPLPPVAAPREAPPPRAADSIGPPPRASADIIGPPPAIEDRADYDAFAHQPPFRPRRNRARLWTAIAIVAAALMLAAIAAISVYGLPGFARLGGGGGPVPLSIEASAMREALASGNELLRVSGRVTNLTDDVQRVPQIRAELRDAQGRVLFSWPIAPPVNELQPRQSTSFNAAQVDVPQGATDLNVSFGPAV